MEDGLSLTTETGLLAVITPTALSKGRFLALLVLSDLVLGVNLALGTESVLGLGYVHL